MIFITAADTKPRYAKMAIHWSKQLKKLGQKHKVYPIEKKSIYESRRMKPSIILKAFKEYGDNIVWLDVDALLLKPIPEVFATTFDVGLTYRGAKRVYINSGVNFFKHNKRSKRFIEKWMDEIPKETPVGEGKHGDQFYLNRMVFRSIKKGHRLKEQNKTIEGADVHFFDLHKYNAYRPMLSGKITNESIIHFLGWDYEEYSNWLKEWNLG